MVEQRLLELNKKYDNAIAVFGGAYWAHQVVISGNFDEFVLFLGSVIRNARFYNWHESVPQALRRFCHLCLVDPTLVEVYLGMSLEQLVKEV
jgi:hypothetical protein